MRAKRASVDRLVRRMKRLLDDIERSGMRLSLGTGGGQPSAFLHDASVDISVEQDKAIRLGSTGIGDMVAW